MYKNDLICSTNTTPNVIAFKILRTWFYRLPLVQLHPKQPLLHTIFFRKFMIRAFAVLKVAESMDFSSVGKQRPKLKIQIFAHFSKWSTTQSYLLLSLRQRRHIQPHYHSTTRIRNSSHKQIQTYPEFPERVHLKFDIQIHHNLVQDHLHRMATHLAAIQLTLELIHMPMCVTAFAVWVCNLCALRTVEPIPIIANSIAKSSKIRTCDLYMRGNADRGIKGFRKEK